MSEAGTVEPGSRGADATAAAPAMVLGGAVSLQGGSTVARNLIPIAGVPGTVALRVAFGAMLLALWRRPSLPAGRRQLALMAGIALVLVVQHLTFYAAIDRLPLGVVVTLEFFCGPLALAFAGSRRLDHLLWVLVAAAGVVLASNAAAGGEWDALGAALAVVAGITWALYIMLFPRAGEAGDRVGALTTITIAAAVIALPYGIAVDHAGMFTWKALGLCVVVALLTDVIAYSLQAHALSRLSARTFSVLSSTQPAVAALFGLVALGQQIDGLQWVGIAAVTAASAMTGLER
ncbi:MAG TPA: EamA family transporter [Baekduia sp.]